MKLWLLALFLLVFVCASSAIGQMVSESESSIVVNKTNVAVSLVVAAKKGQTLNVDLKLLDVDGSTRSTVIRPIAFAAGKKTYEFELPINALSSSAMDEIAWWRLAYRIGDVNGIVSLTELLRDDFDLRASAFQRVVPGQTFRVRVRSLNPFTERAVKNVGIRCSLKLSLDTELDEDELQLNAGGRTDGNGFAEMDFEIPPEIRIDDDPEITIIGQKNGVVRKIEADLDGEDLQSSAILTADKPLYQPGQTFNVRALLLDANNTIVPGAELEFKIEDEDETVLFRQSINTSAFGIGSISWRIPDNAKLGTYRVVVEGDDDLSENQLRFKVSRYDLPNFSVATKSDKSYYLTTDKVANVTVSADYLFGKPVPGGKVRVVQESDRKWNYRAQKYDVQEGAIVEGTADSTGKFVAKLDLAKSIAELKDREWRRYDDLSFAAYVTDPTTNRTEQRRFDLRLTKEPIHIYLVRSADQHTDLPLTAYVSTFYADGTPASCNVDIKDRKETVARIKTNAIGAGKIEFDIPRENMIGSRYEIQFTARDKKGQVGTFEETFYMDSYDTLRIRSDKSIYKPGEMIDVEILSTKKTGYVYVDVVRQWSTVASRVVELRDGKAQLTIPYQPNFTGDLLVAAYTDKVEGRWYYGNSMRAVRGVIFPERQNLVIDAKFEKAEYKPGEDATVRFAVRDGSRRPAESAIGLGIFDKAIEERARTEADFGEGLYGRFFRFMGYERSFGNIALKDINDLDLSRPISSEMQLAAEIMLAGGWYYPAIYHSGNLDSNAKALYRSSTTEQMKPVAAAIEAEFAKSYDHPTDQRSLETILGRAGIDYSKVLDPWGQPYVAKFSINRTQNIVAISTNGPDKKPGTADDFDVWSGGYSYFAKTGKTIDEAAQKYHERTGGHIRDFETLVQELQRLGLDRSHFKDRWGRDYRGTFEVAGRHYLIRWYSFGPNGVFEPDAYRSDDFEVWKTHTDYFAESERNINRVLSDEVNSGKKPFPKSVAEFTEILRRGGIDLSSVTDGWERPVYVTARVETRYADKVSVDNGKTTVKPVTQELRAFDVRSEGPTAALASDDVTLATFSGAITEAHKGTGFAKSEVKTIVYSGAKGAISGTVTDATGAVIPGAEVTATNSNDETQTFAETTNDEGKYLLANLPSGTYTLSVVARGFNLYRQTNLTVRSQSMVEVNVTLEIGTVSMSVDVVSSSDDLQTTSSNMTTTSKTVTTFKIPPPDKQESSTPRLREYFPETLVWNPELLTDKKGKAELSFKMADNITTWKMFAIASNKRGKVGVVEKEVTAFQSFFVDLDPPKFLTEGDEIHLPTQVRNYTEKQQRVEVTMDKADWFTFVGNDAYKQTLNVANGSSQNALFGFKAVSPVVGGKQRVTAIAQSDSDAIEKPVTVRPNGEEIVRTDSRVFNSSTKFDVNFPNNALANTPKAELKIYPNLFSHVAESVEGMLQRPYGCGEQTISSTYPNLMILKFTKEDSKLREKAERYLQKGYERLTGYQVADGGFSYWGGRDTSDVALTAYALRFLSDAEAFIEVDEKVIERAEKWLISQQRPDGSWTKAYSWEKVEDLTRTKLFTSYVARTLAMNQARDKSKVPAPSPTLVKALAYLKTRNGEIDEPYALALFGLASLDAGDSATAKQIAQKLETMAIPEATGVYWKLETNTPFYGWGTAGRIETTALVIQLLTKVDRSEGRVAGDAASKGISFLLKNKDRYGVWYSTQTTINVLDAFLVTLAGNGATQPQTIQVSVNGVALPDIVVPAGRVELLSLDLRNKLTPQKNVVEVRSTSNSPVMAQAVASHYLDWRDSQASSVETGPSRALRLEYKCDKPKASIMEEVSCSVEAERIGFKGYGMLLAEIGTPPGADVSRESLEAALQSDWSLSRYDVLPDRIVLYMWSKAGGTKFNFKFRPRYGINAQTPASIVYDYYNPEAYATVVPLRFDVR